MPKRHWKELSLREKIGQTIVMTGSPEKDIEKYGSLENYLEKYPIGGLFIGGEVIKSATDGTEDMLKATAAYREVSKIPLFFCGDMENGCGDAVKGLTRLPSQMALGAANSEELAYEYGKTTAIESLSVGVNWSFSPVADLNQNTLNSITNYRAIGDDPQLVKRLLAQVVKGMQDYGLAATAKHFPGDGVDRRNQHIVTTHNTLSVEEWYKNHGAVFKHLIDNGLYSIMAGHIAFPHYQKETKGGRYLPATLSRELINKLLKQEMGFKGVVVSDALIMGGFLGWYERIQAEIQCFKAGIDMMLWPTLEYFDALEKAILSGEVSMERLDDAVERIWTLKEKLGLFEEGYKGFRQLSVDEKAHAKNIASLVADKSITLMRDSSNQMPLKADEIKNAFVVAITTKDEDLDKMSVFKEELEARGVAVKMQRGTWFTELEEIGDQYDVIIYLIYNKIGFTYLGDDDRSWGAIWSSLCSSVDKSIVVSMGSPYYFNEYYEGAKVYINTYSVVPDSQKSLVKAMFGEIPFMGKSPVEL